MVRIHTWFMGSRTASRNRAKDVIMQIIWSGADGSQTKIGPANAPNGGSARGYHSDFRDFGTLSRPAAGSTCSCPGEYSCIATLY
jgi:hypothetical protein